MGFVFRAHDEDLNVDVALKMVKPELRLSRNSPHSSDRYPTKPQHLLMFRQLLRLLTWVVPAHRMEIKETE